MKIKKKILIFSDCFTYSGSEVVIENLLLSNKIERYFNLEFLYGYNKSYDIRFNERIKYLGLKQYITGSIKLLSPDWYVYQKMLDKKYDLKYLYLLIRILILRGLKFFFISHLVNFITLRSKFKKSKPDIVYINNGGYPASLQCILAVFVAKSSNINVIYFNINNMAMERSKWYHNYLDKYLDRSVTKFITASYAAQNEAVEKRSFRRDSFVRIPNTIYSDRIIAKTFNTRIVNTVIRFGSVGLLTQRKGFHVLLEAVGILVNELNTRTFEVFLIGEGEEKESLMKLVNKYNIHEQIRFLGYNPKPLEEVSQFDVFILPSIRNEDFPYVILEAMVLGKPIIGTRVAGIPEQIENEVTGLLVEPDNPNELAEAMKVFFDAEIRKQCGIKSKIKYFNEFNFDIIENKYFELFDK